jgi:hypothetical protein
MSRSLGLREDQRVGEVLATLIIGLFPLDPVSRIREQARSHKGSLVNTTYVNTPDQMWERACSRRGPNNQRRPRL